MGNKATKKSRDDGAGQGKQHPKGGDDAVATDHFDNLQSTNWNTVRLKPPVGLNPEGEPGWRTEFRPMEVQLTDFENAAFSVKG